VRPLVRALNRLLGRLRVTLDNERRFTADAAHELRTPLAALKIHAQVAQASTDPEDRGHALAQMVSGVERTSRLVEQLLRLARLDPMQGLQETQPVDLNALIHAAEADLADQAARQGRQIDVVAGDEPVVLQGDADMLHVALRNLLENALRHTPAGSHIEMTLARDAREVRLSVADDGPGVPQEELDRLGERFYRGSNVTTEGSGLGLAIVQRIALLHGARLELRNRAAGGLAATLVWPAPVR
jgi:two-component system sensor histidine kinase QseC